MEHQLDAIQEAEPLKRHLPVAGHPPVFDRSPHPQAGGNMALQRHARETKTQTAPALQPSLHPSGHPLDHTLGHPIVLVPVQSLDASTRSVTQPRLGLDPDQVKIARKGAGSEYGAQARAHGVHQAAHIIQKSQASAASALTHHSNVCHQNSEHCENQAEGHVCSCETAPVHSHTKDRNHGKT